MTSKSVPQDDRAEFERNFGERPSTPDRHDDAYDYYCEQQLIWDAQLNGWQSCAQLRDARKQGCACAGYPNTCTGCEPALTYKDGLEAAAKIAESMPMQCDEERHAYRFSDYSKAMSWDISHAIRALIQEEK